MFAYVTRTLKVYVVLCTACIVRCTGSSVRTPLTCDVLRCTMYTVHYFRNRQKTSTFRALLGFLASKNRSKRSKIYIRPICANVIPGYCAIYCPHTCVRIRPYTPLYTLSPILMAVHIHLCIHCPLYWWRYVYTFVYTAPCTDGGTYTPLYTFVYTVPCTGGGTYTPLYTFVSTVPCTGGSTYTPLYTFVSTVVVSAATPLR